MNNKENDKLKEPEVQEEVIQDTLPGDKAIRIRRTRLASLKRTLGVTGIFSIAYGNLGSSIYYALGVTALYAMGATPFVFIIAALFFLFTAASYAEGTAAIPEAGGASSFARKGFNELVSFIAGWCLLLGYIVTISIAAFAAIGYLGSLEYFSYLADYPWNVVGTGVLLLILMVINVIGIKSSVVFSTMFTLVDIATQAFLIIMGLFLFLDMPKLISRIHLGVVPTWKDLIFSFYVVMISFMGIETISNLAEESRDPGETIPRSIWWSMGTVILTFFLVSAVALSAMPVQYQVEGYVYSVPRTEKAADSSYLGSRNYQLVYYGGISPKTPGIPVSDAIIKVTELVKDPRDNPHEWRLRTDDHGFFKLQGLGLGKHTFKIFKKPMKELEFIFDTAKPAESPLNGLWTTDLTVKWKNDPVAGIANAISEQLPMLKGPLMIWVSLLAFTVLIIAANAGILGASRLIFSMGMYQQVPQVLARVNKKSHTPYVAVIVFTLVAFVIVLPADIAMLAEVYAFAALISYAIAHASIIAMRIRFPDLERPYKIPFNIRIGGREIPLTSIIGGVVYFAIWLLVAYYKDYGRNVGIFFIVSGLLIYWLYRRHRGMSLTETRKLEKKR